MNRVFRFSFLILGLLLAVPAQAEVFRPATVRGALIGGLAGAVIGHNDGRRGWEGAAYGTAAGAVIGSIVGDARDRRIHRPRYDRSWSHAPRWSISIGHHHGRRHRHSHFAHGSFWQRDHFGPSWIRHRSRWYDHGYRRAPVVYRAHAASPLYPEYRARGAFWGGIAGAVIGHNHGRRGWEGAGYGAAGGYLLGSLIENRARQRAGELAAAAAWSAPVTSAPATPAPAQVTIINNVYTSAPATPMASANRAFGR